MAMDTTIAIPRMELLQVADAVAREKSIDRDEVLIAMEQAIQKAGRSKYGHEHDIRAAIDRKTGEIKLTRVQEVVDTVVENEATQIPLKAAHRRDPRRGGARVAAPDRSRSVPCSACSKRSRSGRAQTRQP